MKASYEKILNADPPVSRKHPSMSMNERAAQFAPFAALTGYEDAVRETARVTEDKLLLDDSERERLDRILREVLASPEPPTVCVTFFRKDAKKEGGSRQTHTGVLLCVDPAEQTLLFSDRTSIPLVDLYEIEVVSGT